MFIIITGDYKKTSEITNLKKMEALYQKVTHRLQTCKIIYKRICNYFLFYKHAILGCDFKTSLDVMLQNLQSITMYILYFHCEYSFVETIQGLALSFLSVEKLSLGWCATHWSHKTGKRESSPCSSLLSQPRPLPTTQSTLQFAAEPLMQPCRNNISNPKATTKLNYEM